MMIGGLLGTIRMNNIALKRDGVKIEESKKECTRSTNRKLSWYFVKAADIVKAPNASNTGSPNICPITAVAAALAE